MKEALTMIVTQKVGTLKFRSKHLTLITYTTYYLQHVSEPEKSATQI